MRSDGRDPDFDLRDLAVRAMGERGLLAEFPEAVTDELTRLPAPVSEGAVDQRALPWCSIDNDDSRDLDQLTSSERIAGGAIRVRIAVADVAARVRAGSAIDLHAAHNTTSVYTPACIFPMLPERLSTDLTSLNPDVDRLATVAELDIDPRGDISASRIYRAQVHNHAKLAYDSVAAWLDGTAPAPAAVARDPLLQEQLHEQDEAAQCLRARRHQLGALDLETIEARAVMRDGKPIELRQQRKNRARQLIEDLMIAANGAAARFLAGRGWASIRRVVRTPERWDRIVDVAAALGGHLPGAPDAGALERFLAERRRSDPLRYPDLCLTVVKLMGRGEYVVERPGEATGHFGLAVRDYAHSTAPNRRYPDLITQRLIHAALAGQPSPYPDEELERLAGHCTEQEDNADKVERRVRKSAAALMLRDRIGTRYDALVTGAADKGTWVRTLAPPVEGKVVRGARGLQVGDQVRVELLGVDVEQGFIDFAVLR